MSDSALHYNSLGEKAAEMSRRCKFKSKKKRFRSFPLCPGNKAKKGKKYMDVPHEVESDTRAEELWGFIEEHHNHQFS